jgi:mono/diheme cytochrome c family protein
MQHMKVVLAALSVFAMTTATAAAADVANGEALAKRWCAFCHVVAPGQRRGSDVVPTFASIGSRPNFDAKAIAAFIMTPHPGKMPNMSLTRVEAADLAAYIKSQGK